MSSARQAARPRLRALGFALDRLFVHCFKIPVPNDGELNDRVRTDFRIPQCGKHTLSRSDVGIVLQSADFVVSYVAEFLPVQVLCCDTKEFLPTAASSLAVRKEGSDVDYIGSFDFLARVRCTRAVPWKQFNNDEMAVDVKLTSATHLGIIGMTVRQTLTHTRLVMQAARREGARVISCKIVAFLFYRPVGESPNGKDSFGFVAYEASTLNEWKPDASDGLPAHICLYGQLLKARGASTPADLPTPPRHVAVVRNRWTELAATAVRSGWVFTTDFCKNFELGTGNRKHAVTRVHKRLREHGYVVVDEPTGKRAPPGKMSRISDLKQLYG